MHLSLLTALTRSNFQILTIQEDSNIHLDLNDKVSFFKKHRQPLFFEISTAACPLPCSVPAKIQAALTFPSSATAPRTVSLILYRNAATQRAHFAIFIPSATNQGLGTLIHVIGAPMAGYQLEFKRNYSHALTQQPHTRYEIGQIDSQYIVDAANDAPSKDSTPKGAVELAAGQVPPPGISQNFLGPVDDTRNKRCQEWTMEYVRHLVHLQYLDAGAIQIVQSKRDPPTHGVGLQPLGRGQELGGGGQAAGT
ncbi:hypothetical protein I7I48_09664 [Histoplasma ohiense]|nr:hypothetical protein I7I48_09664 [Histoplasma ohiense (nom. inval.)]